MSKKKPKKIPRRKNISQTIENGQIVHTKDQHFFGNAEYRKPGYQGKGNYRKAVVVDSNRNDDLALVKLTTSPKGIPLSDGKAKFRAYIETRDEHGRPIRINGLFIPSKQRVSKADVVKIKKETVSNPYTGARNRKKLRRLKGRDK